VSLRTWIYVFLAVALDGCAALVAGLFPESKLARLREPLVGFSAGVLIATALLDMLPEAFTTLPARVVLGTVLATLAAMVLLEWTIGHRLTTGTDARSLAPVLLGADGFHNAADGAAIAAAFLASPKLGVIAATAVIVHEVPEEVADYVLLRKAGMSRRRALLAMTGVQLTAAVGALLTLLGAESWKKVAPFALAIAAGTFLHIAEVDLIPTIIATDRPRHRRFEAVAAFVLGVAVVVVATFS
jgi:zinc and cadmium transporter